MESFTVARARERFSEVLDSVTTGPVEITRHGHPSAYIVSPEMFKKLTEPDASHLLVSQDVVPATLRIEQLVAIEPEPADGEPPLSALIEQMREDRL